MMRRIFNSRQLGRVLVALGAFLIVAGVLVRAYAYPQLARIPSNYDTMTYLDGKAMTVFDTSTLKPVTTDVTVESHSISGNYPDAPSGTVVWANNTTVRLANGSVFQQTSELAPFDAVTGAATNYNVGFSSTTEGDRVSVVRTGQVYKFPFNTGKHDYQQWDSSIGKATTAKYSGTATVDGIKTYKFVQTIAPTQIGTQEVPGSVFGVNKPSVEATMMYGVVRTLYIEPATGSPINRIENRDQYMSYKGVDVPVFSGTLQYTAASMKDIADKVKSTAPMLDAMRFELPLGFGLAGAVAVVGGVLLLRRRITGISDQAETRQFASV